LEHKIEFIESVGLISVFVLVLLSFFLFTVHTKNKLSNRLFAIYLLVIAFDLIGLFTSKTLEYPAVHYVKIASSLLQLPLFYLYVLSTCYSNFKVRTKHCVHFLLFIVFLFIFYVSKLSETSVLLYEIVGEIQYVFYMVSVFMVLKKYRTVYLENYSNANFLIYKWLFQITVLFCVGHLFVLTKLLFSFYFNQDYIIDINIVISLSVLSITIFFVLKALYQPQLFTGININLDPVDSFLKNKTKSPPVKETELDSQNLNRLTTVMNDKKPYLDFDLTLQKLAVQTDIPEKELSILINQHLGKHFYDFVNEYRINDAKKLLKDTSQKELTVLEILYKVGFNSKSSFYTAFKKSTDQTPTQFRKSTA